MTPDVPTFEESVRRGLGICVECGCGKTATFRAADFCGVMRPGQAIEERIWRCSWCGERARSVRYTRIDRNDREGLAQWRAGETR